MNPLPIDYERIIQELYEALLRPGDIVVDIGAHLGRHTLPLARCTAPLGKVFAVEPLPFCRQQLEAIIEQTSEVCETSEVCDGIAILPFALSDWPGKGSFVVAEQLPAFSGLKEVPYPDATSTHHIPVIIETFDNLFADLPQLNYIKLDAEGAELHILRGAAVCLDKFRPVVGFEFGTFANEKYDVFPADMADFWIEKRYRIYAITGQRLTKTDFIRCAEQRQIWDYVAVPAEDAGLNQIVHDTLNRPRVNWLAVRAQLNHANDHADIGAAVPPLRRWRGTLRPVARGLAWLFLLAGRMITIPQRLCNHALLLALHQLTDDLEKTERACHQRDRKIRELEQRIEKLEQRRASEPRTK